MILFAWMLECALFSFCAGCVAGAFFTNSMWSVWGVGGVVGSIYAMYRVLRDFPPMWAYVFAPAAPTARQRIQPMSTMAKDGPMQPVKRSRKKTQ